MFLFTRSPKILIRGPCFGQHSPATFLSWQCTLSKNNSSSHKYTQKKMDLHRRAQALCSLVSLCRSKFLSSNSTHVVDHAMSMTTTMTMRTGNLEIAAAETSKDSNEHSVGCVKVKSVRPQAPVERCFAFFSPLFSNRRRFDEQWRFAFAVWQEIRRDRHSRANFLLLGRRTHLALSETRG